MIRIVKLTLKEEHTNDFLTFLETKKEKINSFPGCNGMKLLQTKDKPHLIFTYSKWESEDDLENYRHSELFSHVWTTVKPWFKEKAEAYSTETWFDGFPAK